MCRDSGEVAVGNGVERRQNRRSWRSLEREGGGRLPENFPVGSGGEE